MLILSRKLNESIVIDGRIIVKILRIDRDTVKLGIQAPADLPVHRQEIYDAIQRGKQAPATAAGGAPSQNPVRPNFKPTSESPPGSTPPGSNNSPPKQD